MTETSNLAMYNLLDTDREPADNSLEPSVRADNDGYEYWETGRKAVYEPHPDMYGYTCSNGFTFSEDGMTREF